MLYTLFKVGYLLFKTFNQSFGNLTQKNATLATRVEENGIGVLEQLLWEHINNIVSQFGRGEHLIIAKIGNTRKHVGIIDGKRNTGKNFMVKDRCFISLNGIIIHY